MLTFTNSFSVNQHWLVPLRKHLYKSHSSIEDFSLSNGLNYFTAAKFFQGNPVSHDIFENICKALSLDAETIKRPFKIKLFKLHCKYAGFVRAKIKRIETRKTSAAIGKYYRDWVAIASTHSPKEPDWSLVKQVAELAALSDPDWLNRLDDPELYKPGCILAIARVADVWQMTQENITESELERLVGGWEPGRWAIELEDFIIPESPIPYDIPVQGAIYLTPQHEQVYRKVFSAWENKVLSEVTAPLVCG